MPAIKKEEFDKLYDPENITKADYDRVISKIHERFNEICEIFLIQTGKANGRTIGWYDFANCADDDADQPGEFDPELYKETIMIDGGYIQPPPGFELAFPTRWLWTENWEEEMRATSLAFQKAEADRREKAKQQREDRKQKREQLKASILAKLTPEEAKIIKWK